MKKNQPCPNCGATIVLPFKTNYLVCPQCNKELILESDSKLYLANPSNAYLDQDRKPDPVDLTIPDNRLQSPELSESRQKRTAMLVQERIAQERKRRQEGMLFGYVGITIGLIFLGLLGIQIYSSGANEFNIAGVCLATIFVIVETWVVQWFRKTFPLDK